MVSELWSEIRYRLRALLRRNAVEQELDEELRFHLEREAAKNIAQGMPRAEAMRRAQIAFGGLERIKDDTRDSHGTRLIEEFGQDVRYGWRGLRAGGGFTAVVVTTLALGVGANAAMFGVLDRLLYRSPSFLIDPASVQRVYLGRTTDGRNIIERRLEYPTYTDLAQWGTAFSQTAGFAYRDEPVGSGEAVEERVVAAVSSSFFDFFTARPVIGRFFAADEDVAPQGTAVVVLSNSYWRARYAGRNDILGTELRIGPETYRVIGVAPPRFSGINDLREPIGFVPMTRYGFSRDPRYSNRYNWNWAEMLVRRNPGVTAEAVNVDLSNAYQRSWEKRGWTTFEAEKAHALAAPVQVARGPMAGPESRVVKWVSGVAFIVLLIACANVANLLLVRAVRRRRELVLRNALGGTRARIVRQLLTETLMLAVIGGASGLLAAHWGGGLLRRFFLEANSAADVFGDARTLVFATIVTVATAIIAGLIPAFQSSAANLSDSLRAGPRDASYRRSRLRGALVVVQAALSVVLLVGAGLFVRSLGQLRAIRLGYDVTPIVYVYSRYRGTVLTAAEQMNLAERMMDGARRVPGVMSATVTTSIPFLGGESQSLYVAGIDSVRALGRFTLQRASPDYFATMGTRILRGRGIQSTDRSSSPSIAVVSESMAQALWPGRDAIGQCFRIRSDTVPCTTVVGIAENVRMLSVTSAPEFHYYVSSAQHPTASANFGPELFVRVSGNASDFHEAVRASVQRIMPGTSYVTARPLMEAVGPTYRSWELGATLFLTFGLLALSLATIGLYSIIAFGVSERTHELGVRTALGARTDHLLGLVVGEGLRLIVAGLLIGGIIALAGSRWLTPLLFKVSPRDPLIYVVVLLTLIAIGVIATALPAIRATRVDPVLAFKSE
jgi:putative ABC transport system permease protein